MSKKIILSTYSNQKWYPTYTASKSKIDFEIKEVETKRKYIGDSWRYKNIETPTSLLNGNFENNILTINIKNNTNLKIIINGKEIKLEEE